jgi:Xaa-Pro aminopeptidase
MVADPRFQARAGRIDDAHSSLSLTERDRRWTATRAEMDKRGIDCLFVVGRGNNDNGNTRWLDNGDFTERNLLFPIKGNPVIFWMLPIWERWYIENSWEGCDFRANYNSPSIAAAQAIEDLGYGTGTIGVVGLLGEGFNPEGSIPYMTYQNLKARLPNATFCDASDLLIRLRMFKSDEEIQMIEKASELANIEFDALIRNARPGIRESDLATEILYASLKAGNEMGRDHWFIMCSGKTGYPVNRRPTDKIIRSGELILTGNYTRFGGYWAHPHFAVSLGSLDEEYKPMQNAVLEATRVALDLLKPGTCWEELDRKIDEQILFRGYYHEITQIHCVGIDGIEPPATTLVRGKVPARRFPLNGTLADNEEYRRIKGDALAIMKDFVVQPGLAVALEVKAVKDDRIFIEFGPQLIVTKDGPRVMTPEAMDVVEL